MGSGNLAGAWNFGQYADTWLPLVILFGMTLFMLLVMMIVLRRRDPV